MGIQVDSSDITSNLDETHLFRFQGLPQMRLSDVKSDGLRALKNAINTNEAPGKCLVSLDCILLG